MTPLYQGNAVHVYHADAADLMVSLGSKAVDLVITDPPYTEHVHANIRSVNTSDKSKPRVKVWTPGFAALENFEHVPLALEVAKRWVLMFCALESFADYREASGKDWKGGGCYVRSGIWRKQQAAPQLSGDRPANSCEGIAVMHPRISEGRLQWNGRGKHAYWDVSRETLDEPIPDIFVHGRDRSEKRHPSQKPASLIEQLVDLFSNPGEVILDPYCGSGSTGAACLKLGRACVLADSDLGWAQYAADRMRYLESEKPCAASS